MPREGRIVVAGAVHHVRQRGNHRQQVFFSDCDRRLYLGLVRESAELAQVELWGWSLMTNHVHWLYSLEQLSDQRAFFGALTASTHVTATGCAAQPATFPLLRMPLRPTAHLVRLGLR
jgi:REP element-mobilizing transposase RayT